MDYNLNKDFENRKNNTYVNYQEQTPDFIQYQTINNPKIPMSYYFPEGNQRKTQNRNYVPTQYQEEQVGSNPYYVQNELGNLNSQKKNYYPHNEELLANAIKIV